VITAELSYTVLGGLLRGADGVADVTPLKDYIAFLLKTTLLPIGLHRLLERVTSLRKRDSAKST